MPTSGTSASQWAVARHRFLPARGFGKLWREREEVRQRLGYSWQEGETYWRFVVQPFAGGLALEISEDANPGGSTYGYYGNVFLFYNIGRSEVLSGRYPDSR